MYQHIGSAIRQLRRERNLTQTELGEAVFSKSYVSAVEIGKITPSTEALKHFARCLGQPEDYFIEIARQLAAEAPAMPVQDAVATIVNERTALLNVLLASTDYGDLAVPASFFTFSPERLALLAAAERARYHFLHALAFQKEKNYHGAVFALEAALNCETDPRHLASILDALSQCYMELHTPHLALSYVLRARQVLCDDRAALHFSDLALRVELHCGEIYLALCRYQLALEHFEEARSYLDAQQNIQSAAHLYWGLGYCTYALIFQDAVVASRTGAQVERGYQQALSYFLQSLTISRICSDRLAEHFVSLTLAMVQLDFCTWRRRQLMKQGGSTQENLLSSGLTSSLDEAWAHCQQVLISLSNEPKYAIPQHHEQALNGFVALALMIRIAIQRALVAFAGGFTSTFVRERSFALSLCQHTLDSCKDPLLLTQLVWSLGNLSDYLDASLSPALLHLPEFPTVQAGEEASSLLLSQAGALFAAGEVAEMLALTSTNSNFIGNCYAEADSCCQQALAKLSIGLCRPERKKSGLDQLDDRGYLLRMYQRYISLLEERLLQSKASPEHADLVARATVVLFKQYLKQAQEGLAELPLGTAL